MRTVIMPVIINGNYSILFSTIAALSAKHNITTKTHPVFIYTESNYLTGYPDPDGITIEYIFFIGEPQFETQESTAALIKSTMPESEIVVLELPINEERLLSIIEEKFQVHHNKEGQQSRRLP